MNENPQDEGRDFSTPDILFQMSPRILPNETKERKNKVNEKNGAFLLSLFRLEVWFFLKSLMHSPSSSSPDARIPSNHALRQVCVTLPPLALLSLLPQLILLLSPDPSHDTAVLLQLSSVSPLLPPPLVLIVALWYYRRLSPYPAGGAVQQELSLSLSCWRVANSRNSPKPWLSPWPRKLLPETSVSGQQSRHEDGRARRSLSGRRRGGGGRR